MVAVGKKGSYHWNSNGTLLIMLPKGNFTWQTKRCWLDSEVHEAIGVDLSQYSVRVVCEGDHVSDDPWYVERSVVFAGGDVMLYLSEEETVPAYEHSTEGEKIMLTISVLFIVLIFIKMLDWTMGSLM